VKGEGGGGGEGGGRYRSEVGLGEGEVSLAEDLLESPLLLRIVRHERAIHKLL